MDECYSLLYHIRNQYVNMYYQFSAVMVLISEDSLWMKNFIVQY